MCPLNGLNCMASTAQCLSLTGRVASPWSPDAVCTVVRGHAPRQCIIYTVTYPKLECFLAKEKE